MKKKIVIGFTLILLLSLGIFVYTNVPIRTSIFRSMVKGDSYIITDLDTIYSFGHYGIKKWLRKDSNTVELLSENGDFCHNTLVGWLIGRGGIIHGRYLYVTCRSYLGGADKSNTPDYVAGKLLVVDKYNLRVLNQFDCNIKLVEAKITGNSLIVSGLCGFDIYDISTPVSPKLKYRYRSDKFTEFQGFSTFESDSCCYIAFSKFTEGISIWEMTQPERTHHVIDISIQDTLVTKQVLPKDLQCCDVELKYPYLYASLSSVGKSFNTENDRKGVFVCDISNLSDIKSNVALIPKNFWQKRRCGDPMPTFIDIYKNNVYVNLADRGIAVFDISNPLYPSFKKTMSIKESMLDYIYPIHIDNNGLLYSGCQYFSKIHITKL